MIFVANIWPIMDSFEKRQEISKMIETYGQIQKKIEIDFTRKGLRNYLLQIYGHQKWTGSFRNHYRQIWKCVDRRYKEGSCMQSYVFECESLHRVMELKNEVREMCGIKHDSIHISDTVDEAAMMMELLESENCVELMNGYMPDHYRCFTKNLDRIKKYCGIAGISIGDILIVSEAVNSLYEKKPCRKISWVFLSKPKGPFPERLERLNSKEYEADEEILNPDNQVLFCGFRFITLEQLQKLMQKNNKGLYRKQRIV